jgi:hypothetical protein
MGEQRPARSPSPAITRRQRELLFRLLSAGTDSVRVRSDGTVERISSLPTRRTTSRNDTRRTTTCGTGKRLDLCRAKAYALKLRGEQGP